MTQSKLILYIVGTPYQLITAFNLSTFEYNSLEFRNVIYFSRSVRTNYDAITERLNENTELLRFDAHEIPQLVKKLEKTLFFRFFLFQENSIFFKYLAFKLKKKGTLIALAPDGTKPYAVFDKDHEHLSVIRDTLIDYIKLFSKRLFLFRLYLSQYYRYGSFKLLDEVWLQYPELFNSKQNNTKGTILKLPELSENTVHKLSELLNFKSSLTEHENIILYFNQPFHSAQLIEKEFEILRNLCEIYPNKGIFIKLHPSTKIEIIKRMKFLDRIKVIEDSMAAEFYLISVKKSIIISGWSTALMHDFPELRNLNYYLFPIYKETNDKAVSQINLIEFPHIKMIDSLKKIG